VTEPEVIQAVAEEIASYFAELDDQADDVVDLFGELPRVSELQGGAHRRWVIIRHETDDHPAIRVTVEAEA
jgi:hypothetical protein